MLGFQPENNALEAALLDRGITSVAVYTATNYPGIRLAAIGLMEILLSTANTTNNITGYSVTYDRGAIERRMLLLKEEAGLSARSVIKAISAW